MRAERRNEQRRSRRVIAPDLKRKSRLIRVEVAETRLGIAETQFCAPGLFVSDTIGNQPLKSVTVAPRCDSNPAILARAGNAVTDGILDERLQNQLRHQH